MSAVAQRQKEQQRGKPIAKCADANERDAFPVCGEQRLLSTGEKHRNHERRQDKPKREQKGHRQLRLGQEFGDDDDSPELNRCGGNQGGTESIDVDTSRCALARG